MKTFFRTISVVALVAATFVSCQREVDNNSASEVHFVLNAKMSETKTGVMYGEGSYAPYWNKGDQLGILFSIPAKGDLQNDAVFANTKNTGEDAAFEGSVTMDDGEGITFYSYYPAESGKKVYETDGDITFGLDIPHAQTPVYDANMGYSFDPKADILVARPATCLVVDNTGANEVDMYFTRVTSVLRVALNAAESLSVYGERVKSIKMETSSGEITSRIVVDLKTGEFVKVNTTSDGKTVSATFDENVPVYVGYTGAKDVFFSVAPVTIPAGSTLTFTIETVDAQTGAESHKIVKTVPQTPKDITFRSGMPTVINLNITESEIETEKPFTSKTYNKITAATDLADGEYIICMQETGKEDVYYLENTVKSKPGGKTFATGIALSSDKETITISSKDITDATWNFAAVTGGYSITPTSNDKAGLGTTSANDGLTCQTTYSGKAWTIDDDATYNWTFKFNDTNRYLVVYSIANPRTYTSSSTNANGKILIYQLENNLTALSAPTGLAVSDMTLSWDEVEGAGSYIVTINGITSTVETTSKVYEGDAGYYDVSVVAVPTDKDNYKNSPEATLTGAKFGTPALPTPTLSDGGVTTTSVTANWTVDVNATNGYHCEIYNASAKEDEKDVAAGVGTVTFDGLTEGVTYTVKVNAKEVTGDKPYDASGVATIDLVPDGLHIEDVTAAGTYNLLGLTVMAVSGRNIIAADNTGNILIYAATGHGKVVNDVINVQGTVESYNGVWEFDGPTITAAGTTTATYPTPVEYDETKITAYATTPVIEYGHAIGLANSTDRTVTVADGKVLNVYGDLSSVDGKYVSINGYAFGYYSSKSMVNFMLVGTPTVDDTYPTLSTTPEDGETISWDDDVFGSTNAETITVSLNAAASGYEVSYTDSDNAWTVTDNGDGTITAYPNAANTSTTEDKTLDVTISHKDKAALTSTITLKQKKQSSGGGNTDPITLTFSLTSNPGNWPTENSTTLTDYTYTLNNVDYTFKLKNVKQNSGYLMCTSTAALGLPAIEGYKLVTVKASNSSGCSTSTKVGISSSATTASYINGGAIQTWSTTSSNYTYTLTSTEAETVYYLYITNKNAQITSLELTYNPAE